jgi:hypothetical protein
VSSDGLGRPYAKRSLTELRALLARFPDTGLARAGIIRELRHRSDPDSSSLLAELEAGRTPRLDSPAIDLGHTPAATAKGWAMRSGEQTFGREAADRARSNARNYAAPAKEPLGESEVRPTVEQQTAVELFLAGQPLRINAFAGTGKTTTLLAMAQAERRRGIYWCFNRRLAEEARAKFPQNVSPKTIHGFAFSELRSQHSIDPDCFGPAERVVSVAAISVVMKSNRQPAKAASRVCCLPAIGRL